MKIDFHSVITNYDGEPVLLRPEVPATLRLLAIEALMAPPPAADPHGRPNPLSVDDVLRRDVLARRIHAEPGLLDIKSEDVALIKRQIALHFAPIAVAQACRLLEGELDADAEPND